MKKIIGFRTLKTGLGSVIAMLLAQLIGLQYITSAGVITILSIQNTKRESFEVATRRILATAIALTIGGILFSILGFYAIVFGLYLIIFIPIAVRLKVTEGIVPASVLVTHLLTEKYISWGLLTNEMLLMIIGAGVALLLNLHMPSIEKQLQADKRKIEESMYDILMYMSVALEKQHVRIEEERNFQELEEALKLGTKRAHQHSNNYLINEMSYYEKYFEMRSSQLQVMKYMFKHFEKVYMTFEQTYKVSELTKKVALSVKGKIKVEVLFEELEQLRNGFKESELPNTREEFENRAMLYQFLNDIELFSEIKRMFKEELTPEELQQYNSHYEAQ